MISYKPTKKALVIVIACLGLVALIWKIASPQEAPKFLTAKALRGDIEDTVLASGAIEAFEQVSVGAQVSGQLKSLKVALGDDVKKGQLVAEIDFLTQQNTLKNAEAALANVKAQKQAKEALLRQYQLAFERQKTMLAQDAGSRADFESAESALATTKAELTALDAQIAQAAISVDTAKVNLGYTQITSPITGKVVAIVTKEGQTVNANQSAPTIIKVAQLDKVTIKAEISEADVVRVKAGQKAFFSILGNPEKRFDTVLRSIEPGPTTIADTSTSSTTSSSTSSSSSSSSSSAVYYYGVLDVPNTDGKLRISMTTEVNIVLADRKNVLLIPSTALDKADRDNRYAVRVEKPDGSVEVRRIKIGLNNKVNAEVLEGIKEGEEVVIGEAKAQSSNQNSGRRGPPPMM